MNIDLQFEKVLLTGASRGIGKAIFTQLVDSKATVISHSISPLQENVKQNYKSHLYADLSSEAETIRLFEEAVKIQPELNNVILNAGIFEPHSLEANFHDWLRTWNKTIQINLNAAGILTRLALEHFKKIGGGRLIFISSRAANRGETEEYLAYAASKGGLTSLAKSVARSFGEYNIKSFVVAPGFVKTAMADQFINEYGEQRVLDELSLKELTKPEDLAPLIALMVSGMMDHATGTTIDVNAGSYIR
ncbi:NAD(P)-dependent dehydrogenase, short-chain alcohol dehydrogenase family [Spirosomataceae bacterium TFI 002]|nr:NAD(P)-dependent dehydrogenase, short-chain alcohol dehydrogenase family [Spirosomataceae bacterium TFI 002]